MRQYEREVKRFLTEIKGKHFFVVDTETTGLNPKSADIIEFSALEIDGNTLSPVGELDTFINPGYKLPPEIVEFNQKNHTGINDVVLSEAPSPKRAAEIIAEFLGNTPLIMGHNSLKFDEPFINKLYYENLGKGFTAKGHIDTLVMSKELIEGSHKLCDLFAMTGVSDNIGFHTSISDVKATFEIFKWMLPMYNNKEEIADIKVVDVKRWTKSHTLDRLYVKTPDNRAIYYDILNKEWNTTIDHSLIENAVLKFCNLKSMEDVIKNYT